jgi:hypothetical protein
MEEILKEEESKRTGLILEVILVLLMMMVPMPLPLPNADSHICVLHL